MKILTVIPTYNEKDNIEKMINAVLSLSFENAAKSNFLADSYNYKDKYDDGDRNGNGDNDNVSINLLIIDDNSPDGTAEIILDLKNKKKDGKYVFADRLFLLKRPSKLGLGTAYVQGFKFAAENNYDYVITMDCDFSHDPEEIKKFIETIENEKCGMVVGSRYKDGIRIINWKMSRLLISYFANIYAKFITGSDITDLTGGFNAYSAECLKKINLKGIKSKGYAFQIEMKYRIIKQKCAYKEIPIIFYERTFGKSKMSKSIIFEAFFTVLKLRLGIYK
ncbi:MAG: polyprenol monophosphomannose synthase [Candidatus Acididesulfobacter guangdongensis]|uniref:Polyprenol monophosphomannose synthase n=1 Tax=Acididesulfobacter guangdongensis TaxID=2597225 RepID=A0A519BHH0_ACIG2|nr:MAG: polyprenol monophosphomannose synthase [Candidatus Acididesulfobacter guangdongensis]